MKKQILLSVFSIFLAILSTAGSQLNFDSSPSKPASINVTFQVRNPDQTPVYVFGSWSNWTYWPGNQMVPVGGGIYTATLSLVPDSTYEFLYVSGANPAKEVLNPAWPCTNGNPQYTNRVLTLGSNDTTICYTWATCDKCSSADSIYVTFEVQNPDSVPVYIFGNWSNWGNWPGDPLTHISGNEYKTTLKLKSSQPIEYLFVNGVGPTKEVLNPAWTCTNSNPQYTNRLSQLGISDTILCWFWATCNNCSTTSIDNEPENSFRVKLGSNGLQIFSENLSEVDRVLVYDIMGRLVFASSGKMQTNTRIPVNLSANSFYLIKINAGSQQMTYKGLVVN